MIRHAGRAARRALVYALYYTGLMRVWLRLRLRGQAVVLMYHRVLTADERRQTASHPGIIVDRETFARQVRLLSRDFSVLSADAFIDTLRRGDRFAPGSCLITFDDGWKDNVTNAWPILRAAGLPAVVFLPVNYIGSTRMFWQERLTHVLAGALARVRQEPDLEPILRAALSRAGLGNLLAVANPSRAAMAAAAGRLKGQAPDVVEHLISELAAACGMSPVEWPVVDAFMSWDDVARLAREGMAFGGHGAEHRLLTRLSPSEAEAEIVASRDVIDERLGAPPAMFSYPNGSWNDEVASLAKRHGYAAAFTTAPGPVSADTPAFSLRRVNVHEDMTASMPLFLGRIGGLC